MHGFISPRRGGGVALTSLGDVPMEQNSIQVEESARLIQLVLSPQRFAFPFGLVKAIPTRMSVQSLTVRNVVGSVVNNEKMRASNALWEYQRKPSETKAGMRGKLSVFL